MSSPVPFNDARARLQAASLGGWPFEWPNEPFNDPRPATIWLAVEMVSDIVEPIEMSGGAWVEEGTLMVDIIVPIGWGTDAARETAKKICNTFRGITSGGISYLTAAIGNGGRDPERGKYWVMPVRITWRYQDISVS
jgi:hypothetical protein